MNHSEPYTTNDTQPQESASTTDNTLSLQLYGAFRRTENLLHRMAHTSFHHSDLPPGQAALLHTLKDHNGATPRQLADILAIRPASITPMIQKMEEQGLIERKPNPEDRRSVFVFLTPKGKEQVQEMERLRNQHSDNVFSILTQEDQKTLLRLLETLETEWERVDTTETDYLPYFLFAVGHYPSSVLVEALVTQGVEEQQATELIEQLKESIDIMRNQMKNCTEPLRGPGAARGGQRHGRQTEHGAGRGGEHFRHRRQHNTCEFDEAFRRKGGQGRRHAKGMGRQGYESHHMRRRFAHAGYDIEGVRQSLEELGLDVTKLQKLVESLDLEETPAEA